MNSEPFPTPDRHGVPLYMAGTASYQGWDALMQYAYSQEGLSGGWMTVGNWNAMLASIGMQRVPEMA